MKGVLFDWDGTLINSESLLARIWRKAAEPLGRTIDERKFLPLIGLVARDIAVTLFPEDPPATTDLLLAGRLQVYDEFYNQAKPYPDARECLEGLLQKGYRMAIMTSNSAVRIQNRLRNFGWEKYFPCVVGEGMIAEAKPNAAIVLEAARCLGFAPEECYVVGDARWDILAGNRAGAVTALICRQEERLEELLAARPRYHVQDLRELLEIVEKKV
jgi:HAD superfamily hydrolase (TIGR01509 family)